MRKGYTQNVKGRGCSCGQPAVAYREGWVCARCMALEARSKATEKTRPAPAWFGAWETSFKCHTSYKTITY
jgi:hypothetical protein